MSLLSNDKQFWIPGIVTVLLVLFGFGFLVHTAEARTRKGRTAEELENPANWEDGEEEQTPAASPRLTPRVTAAPTPYQRTQADEEREKFYDRYFRKGEASKKKDIPVTEEEKKSLIQQMIPHFTPTAERDSQKNQIRILIQELGGEHHRRQAAIERLSMIGEPAVPELKKALHDPFKYKRIGALTALGYIRSQEVIPDIQQCLEDKEAGVRQEAVKVIGRMKHRPSAGLIDKRLHDSNSRVRSEAVIALGRIKGSRAEQALIDASQDSDAEIRRLACEELSFFDSPQVLNALVKAAHDNDVDTCLAAIKALGDIGDESVRYELQQLSNHEDRMIRQEALQALSNLD